MKKIFEKHLGPCGRLLCGSKSLYLKVHPENLVVFNSNLIVKGKKVWYGDIDVNRDKRKLNKISREIKKDIYVLYEMDARFENEDKPKLDNPRYIVKFKPKKETK